MFELAGDSIKYFEKTQNGDHFLTRNLKNEGILIAIVADGVSQQPCDWKASEMTCEKCIDFFIENKESSLKERVHKAVEMTNRELIGLEGNCKGLNSTLSLFVWDYKNNHTVICNIGDSRIYKCQDNKLSLITKDDAISHSKQVMTNLGKRTVTASSLTNVIGKIAIEIQVTEIEFTPGSMLLLASDGFFETKKASFERDMVTLSQTGDLKASFDALFSKYEFWAKDDMTAVVVRRKTAKIRN